MRISFRLRFDNVLKLPTQYNHILQAVILKWLSDEKYQNFIHDEGFQHNKRTYKLYTFSRLEGRFTIDRTNKVINYYDEVRFTVASADDRFLSYLVNGFVSGEEIYLGNNRVYIEEINCGVNRIKNDCRVYTKSPIVVYSTFEKEDKKKTYYYNPVEQEFNELIRNNLINKYKAIYGEDPADSEFSIKPVNSYKLKESIVIYKGTVIKGWGGEFILKGSQSLLDIAYNTGLGSKNSQGFGCIELCK